MSVETPASSPTGGVISLGWAPKETKLSAHAMMNNTAARDGEAAPVQLPHRDAAAHRK
ncbi:hypothetical protein G5B40_05910 [Pikeienuella piscinae]|uniref:Uncharacterized protein n=1 Tax=Pikeienuella piscinae TaxID=2748098 RepID=A0A7L5BW16_9RHOB|nr:hypothetical protein [Pikeienuella piscinae]QIE55028.1 hypothetical protein G5B40_05910 [Pikeienuella piscinae]